MNPLCFFVSDLHGRPRRYAKLLNAIRNERPGAVFICGDILPHRLKAIFFQYAPLIDFLEAVLFRPLKKLRKELGNEYPEIFLILGNDDPRSQEIHLKKAEENGLIRYMHMNKTGYHSYEIAGYSFVPPTPFRLKDWEKYDITIERGPYSIPPEAGRRSVTPDYDPLKSTIRDDLEKFAKDIDAKKTIFLFHSPPYNTMLDHAPLEGLLYKNKQVDVHVGSKAIRELVEKKQPYITLHGHIHESAKITGHFSHKIGNTWCLSASHDDIRLALVRFDINSPEKATKQLI